MKHKPIHLGLLMLLMLQATACGTRPQPTPFDTPPTNTPAPTSIRAPTHTRELFVRGEREPGTDWPPGLTLFGRLELSIPGRNATANQGWLELTLTRDRAAIASFRYSLMHASCSNESGTIGKEGYGWIASGGFEFPPLIVNGMFEVDDLVELKVTGQFTSPTHAIATAVISVDESYWFEEPFFRCDYGTWNWSAELK